MRLEDYDRVTGEFKVHEKGDEGRPALVDSRAHAELFRHGIVHRAAEGRTPWRCI